MSAHPGKVQEQAQHILEAVQYIYGISQWRQTSVVITCDTLRGDSEPSVSSWRKPPSASTHTESDI